jgi:hypothetical protein
MTKIARNVARRATGSLLLAATALIGAVNLPISAANAATVTESFNFTASGFVPNPPGFPDWTGSFTITFDPTASGSQSGPLNAFFSNLPATYGAFSYGLTGPGAFLSIFNDSTCSGSFCAINSGADQAVLKLIVAASGGLTLGGAIVGSTTSPRDIFESFAGTVTPTPLPAALPLFATGLGVMGLLGWRRKRKV